MGRQEAKLQVLKPFGPKILRIELPDLITNKLISITDEMFQDENKKSKRIYILQILYGRKGTATCSKYCH